VSLVASAMEMPLLVASPSLEVCATPTRRASATEVLPADSPTVMNKHQ
jgi:hypothetical protein